MRGLPGRRLPMFSNEDLKCLDQEYFNIITTDVYDVTIMSRNTGHYWYLQDYEVPKQPVQKLMLYLNQAT